MTPPSHHPKQGQSQHHQKQQLLYARIVQVCTAAAAVRRDDDDENVDAVGGNILLPSISSKFPAWFFLQSAALSDAGGVAILSNELANLAPVCDASAAAGTAGADAVYDAKVRRFATLLANPSALRSFFSLIDCPQVLLPSALSCLKWKETCNQALRVLSSLANGFAAQTNRIAAGDDGSVSGDGSSSTRGGGRGGRRERAGGQRKIEPALIEAFVKTLPSKIEEVLLFSTRAFETYTNDGNSSSGTDASCDGAGAASKTAEEKQSWSVLIKSSLATLLRYRQLHGHVHRAPTGSEVRIAILCAQHVGGHWGRTGVAAAAAAAGYAGRRDASLSAIAFEDGMTYALAILKVLATVSNVRSTSGSTVSGSGSAGAGAGAGGAADAVGEVESAASAFASISASGFSDAVANTISNASAGNTEISLALQILAVFARGPQTLTSAAGGSTMMTDAGSFVPTAMVDADLLVHLTMPHQETSVQLAAFELWQQLLAAPCPPQRLQQQQPPPPRAAHSAAIASAGSTTTLPPPSPALFALTTALEESSVPPLVEPLVLDRLARGLFMSCQSVICSSPNIALQHSACRLVDLLLGWLGGSGGGVGDGGCGHGRDGGRANTAAAAAAKRNTLQRLSNGNDWTKIMVASATCIPEQARAALTFLASLCNHGGRLEQLSDQKDLLAVALLARQGAGGGGGGGGGGKENWARKGNAQIKVNPKALIDSSSSSSNACGDGAGGKKDGLQMLVAAAGEVGWSDVARALA